MGRPRSQLPPARVTLYLNGERAQYLRSLGQGLVADILACIDRCAALDEHKAAYAMFPLPHAKKTTLCPRCTRIGSPSCAACRNPSRGQK